VREEKEQQQTENDNDKMVLTEVQGAAGEGSIVLLIIIQSRHFFHCFCKFKCLKEDRHFALELGS
jgi:hypothetical protein